MFRRAYKALRYPINEEQFLPVVSAGAVLLGIGTVAYAVGEGGTS